MNPNQEISTEIKKTLARMATTSGDRTAILSNAEWVGAEVEEEIEQVRRDESQRSG